MSKSDALSQLTAMREAAWKRALSGDVRSLEVFRLLDVRYSHLFALT